MTILKFKILLAIIIYFVKIKPYFMLIAFSCTEEKANYTSISLVDLPNCDSNLHSIESKTLEVQLIQKKVFRQVDYIQCSVISRNNLYRCGKSIDTASMGGLFTEIKGINYDECLAMVKRNVYFTNNKVYYLKSDSNLDHISDVTHGSIDSESSCTPGKPLIRNGQQYDRPVIQTEFEIKRMTGKATVDLDEDKIIFEDGLRSKYSKFSTFSADKGFIFWTEPTNLTKCNNNEEFTVLYQGLANKIKDTNFIDNTTFTSYIIQMDEYDFQIGVTNKRIFLCGLPAFVTEHPKLNIIEKPKFQDFILKKEELFVKEVNLLTYINSKLVYLMRHTGEQITSLYAKFAKERCETENRITRNLLTLAILSPIDFAYEYTQKPGSTAIVRGEVVYLIECQPVEVKLNNRDLNECYKEFPVLLNNRSMYMNPRSRLLTTIGTQIDCLQEAPAKFKIDGVWHAFFGSNMKPHSDIQPPNIISVKSTNWEFKPIRGFIGSGIYDPKSLDKLEKFLMNPIEKEVIKETFIRSLEGKEDSSTVINMRNIYPESIEEDLTKRISDKLSGWYKWQYQTGGTFAFILMCFFFLKLIKIILNSLLNFHILYQTLGWGWHLLCFVWTNFTHVLLHNHHKMNHSKIIKENLNDTKNKKHAIEQENEDLEFNNLIY